MKKALLPVLAALLLASASPVEAKDGFKLRSGFDLLCPLENFGTLSGGMGMDFGLGYAFSSTFSVWGTTAIHSMLERAEAESFVQETILSLRLTFGDHFTKAYFGAGFGLFAFYNFSSSPLYSIGRPMAQGTLGLEFSANPGTSLFVEANCGVIFTEYENLVDLPLRFGAIFDL